MPLVWQGIIFVLYILKHCQGVVGTTSSSVQLADVVVYGSTPAGIMAAVAASNDTKLHVILISTNNHIGGMCSGGLGKTDIGNSSVIGGLAKEFFIRNGKYYNKSIEFSLEPHVAQSIFLQMLEESNVSVIIDSPINNCITLEKDSNTTVIAEIETMNNNTYKSSIFIDASYEGDLFYKCNVSFRVGRESNETYGESLNGRVVPRSSNQFNIKVDPLDSNGNLLPYVAQFDNEKIGQWDNHVQAINYRLCVTKNSSNRIPFSKPESYNASNFEILRRQYRLQPPTVSEVPSCNTGSIPNGKYDMNNCGSFSSDFLGNDKYNAGIYLNASYNTRELIAQACKNYTLELLWFLTNDSSIPIDVQNVMKNEWGWCKDEFTNNNYFPTQLYIREGRRMYNKDCVFTQTMAENSASFNFNSLNESIGLGSYNFDSHNNQRFACPNVTVCKSQPINETFSTDSGWYVFNEGDIQINPGIYEIPYMIITPNKDEINNLLVPVGISSSHIGFSTLRLEPQWMIMGHAAGTAANILIETNNQYNVQNIDLSKLKQALLMQGQLVTKSQL